MLILYLFYIWPVGHKKKNYFGHIEAVGCKRKFLCSKGMWKPESKGWWAARSHWHCWH